MSGSNLRMVSSEMQAYLTFPKTFMGVFSGQIWVAFLRNCYNF